MLKVCLFFGLLAAACSHRPAYSPFETEENGAGYGYSEAISKPNSLQVVRFVGRTNTPVKNAELLSQFRAVELCLEKGSQFARFWGVADRSEVRSRAHTSLASFQTPSYALGPYSSYSGTWEAPYGPDEFGNSGRWDQVYVTPSFDTAFSCANKSFGLGIVLSPAPREEVALHTKDMAPAVRVEKLLPDSPNTASLQENDIIIRVNDKRVETLAQLGEAVDQAQKKDKIVLSVVRAGHVRSVKVKAIESTAEDRARNASIISQACSLPEIRGRLLCAHRRL